MWIKGSTSAWRASDSGVPQGSVLEPVLFGIYVNDITEHVKSNIKIFADDTKIYAPTCEADTIQADLDSVMNWAKKWELTFS